MLSIEDTGPGKPGYTSPSIAFSYQRRVGQRTNWALSCGSARIPTSFWLDRFTNLDTLRLPLTFVHFDLRVTRFDDFLLLIQSLSFSLPLPMEGRIPIPHARGSSLWKRTRVESCSSPSFSGLSSSSVALLGNWTSIY